MTAFPVFNQVIRFAEAALVLWSGVAMAQPVAYYPGSTDIRVGVAASVASRCGFSDDAVPGGSFSQPAFDSSGFSHDFAFKVTCNGPSRVAVISSNGGLRTPGSVERGYTTLAPYDVTLKLVGAGQKVASATCSTTTLVVGSTCAFRGPASATQGLYLASSAAGESGSYIRVSAPPAGQAQQLVHGTYTDTLQITLSASP